MKNSGQKLNTGDRVYVKKPKGLKVLLAGSTKIIPQGTTLKIIDATKDNVRLAVPEKAGGGALDINPNKLRHNCAPERRHYDFGSVGYDFPRDLGAERREELLDKNNKNCRFRKTDTHRDVRFLMIEAVEEKLEEVKKELGKRLDGVLGSEKGTTYPD